MTNTPQRLVSVITALALTACGASVEPADMVIAQQQCAHSGGVKSAARHERGKHLTFVCASGTIIEFKRHHEKAHHE